MYFIVDSEKKIIFGWSAKCACSHIKTIYYFLRTNNLKDEIHTEECLDKLPEDIENYITIIFGRNPYERLVSGFLDKYKKNGDFRHRWIYPSLSFSQFVDKLINQDWEVIDYHHFIQQTAEEFDKKIMMSKTIKIYDIKNIDYKYIEQLYEKKIPDYVINKKQGHERQFQIKTNKYCDQYVYDLNMCEYIDSNINVKYFYDEKIMEKVFNFYIDDFNFFEENGINYKL
jgi:hypothetical protein